MSDIPLQELWARFVAGEPLLHEEERALLEALRADPSLAGDAEVDGLLRALQAERRPDEAFIKSVADCLEAERDVDLFVQDVDRKIAKSPRTTRRVTRRLPAAPPVPTAWGGWIAAAAAAAILLGTVALLRTGTPTPPPRKDLARPTPEPEPEPPRTPGRERVAPSPEPRRPEPETPPIPATAPRPGPEAPRPAPLPPPAAPKPPSPAERVEPARTVIVAATVERVEGEAFIDEITGRVAAKAGDRLPAGGVIETVGPKSAAVLRFEDRTRIELAGDTLVRDVAEGESKPPRGKRAFVAKGAVSAEVSKQPQDQLMLFTTPHGEALVVGTTLRISVNGSTRVEVREGRVRVRRKNEARTADVAAGMAAVFAPGREISVRPAAAERKLLLQMDFEGPNAQKDWVLGTIDRTVTFGGSKGSLKSVTQPAGFYTAHVEAAFTGKPNPFPVTDRTMLSFAYYASAPPGEIKVQFRANRTTGREIVGFILPEMKVREWIVVTVRMAEVFRTKAGTGDLIRVPIAELDDLQVHAGTGGRTVDFYLDNLEFFE